MKWFRMYSEVLNDQKVQRLSPKNFKNWVNLLCVASQFDGKIPSIDAIAFGLRMSDLQAEEFVKEMQELGLLEPCDHWLTPHNWNARQYAVTPEAVRQARYRERHKPVTVTDALCESDCDNNATNHVIARVRASESESVSVSASVFSVSVEAKKTVEVDRFDEFWNIAVFAGLNLTDKVKQKTLTEWLSLLPGESEKAIDWYLQQVKTRSTGYVQMPQNFLNEHPWRFPNGKRMAPEPRKMSKGEQAQAEAARAFMEDGI